MDKKSLLPILNYILTIFIIKVQQIVIHLLKLCIMFEVLTVRKTVSLLIMVIFKGIRDIYIFEFPTFTK